MENNKLYDVIEVDFDSYKITMMAQGKTFRNAEAIEKMAIHRRMTESNFFTITPSGIFTDGDKYDPNLVPSSNA